MNIYTSLKTKQNYGKQLTNYESNYYSDLHQITYCYIFSPKPWCSLAINNHSLKASLHFMKSPVMFIMPFHMKYIHVCKLL